MSKRKGFIDFRVFLVGCSRSGTTLLQVLIASHPRIHSFPETSFFINGIGRRRRPLAWLGLATGKERWAMELFLKKVRRQDLLHLFPRRPLFLRTAVAGFIRILDLMTLEAGCDIWLEKSPMHIDYIDFIRKYVPSTRFIHIIRDGRDVVASIYDRSLKHPRKFGQQRDLVAAIRKWNRALRMSLRCIGTPGHSFVLYTHLVERPSEVLVRICGELGVAYDPRMQEVRDTAEQVILPNQQWVMGAMESPRPRVSKFHQLFDQNTRAWISQRLRLDEFAELESRLDALDG